MKRERKVKKEKLMEPAGDRQSLLMSNEAHRKKF